jgi:hypothetical protein
MITHTRLSVTMFVYIACLVQKCVYLICVCLHVILFHIFNDLS